MNRKVILIGNGPSNKFYSPINHLDGGMTAGFNLTEHNVDIIFVSDKKVIDRLQGNPKVHVLKKPFMTKKGGLNLAWNTGHNAYNYLRIMGYTHFEMYGFDLLFSNNWESSTDRVFNKDNWVRQAKEVDINNEWLQYWNEIIDTHTTIHAPAGAELYLNNKHVQINYHENFNY